MPSSSCATSKRRWRWQRNSCSSTSITCRAGKEHASFARLPRLEARGGRTASAAMTEADLHRTVLAVWRIEQPRLLTGLSRLVRDVPLAEDLAQEAFGDALEQWPASGV